MVCIIATENLSFLFRLHIRKLEGFEIDRNFLQPTFFRKRDIGGPKMMHFAADNKHLVYTRASASKARIFA